MVLAALDARHSLVGERRDFARSVEAVSRAPFLRGHLPAQLAVVVHAPPVHLPVFRDRERRKRAASDAHDACALETVCDWGWGEQLGAFRARVLATVALVLRKPAQAASLPAPPREHLACGGARQHVVRPGGYLHYGGPSGGLAQHQGGLGADLGAGIKLPEPAGVSEGAPCVHVAALGQRHRVAVSRANRHDWVHGRQTLGDRARLVVREPARGRRCLAAQVRVGAGHLPPQGAFVVHAPRPHLPVLGHRQRVHASARNRHDR
mmetsp:Transcript_31402/g.60550  ORF Transcript_31402/g.60550 Transcript_31402/m.60550 type:complete len:264 (+) Transcript_31402:590-1381(+)